MKNWDKNLDRFYDKLDERWRALPIKKQRRYTLCFFVGYFLLTVVVLANVWLDTGKAENTISMQHNVQRDSVVNILKTKQ